MRIFGVDCGCDNRKEIMFTEGQLGLPGALILAVIVAGFAIGMYKSTGR